MFADVLEQLPCELLVVGDSGFAHQGWIRGESLDHWILRHLEDAGNLRSICVDVNSKRGEVRHYGWRLNA